ncbi:MAG: hypothetical protein AABY18_08350 [Candidatus Thermoplasmatota archaeon]
MRALIALLFAALAAPLSGCLTCEPQLDLHHCRNATGRCAMAGQVVANWTSEPNLMALFPGIDELVQSLEPGEHGHRKWSDERAETFWQFYNVPADRADKQLFLQHDSQLFHVRVLAC